MKLFIFVMAIYMGIDAVAVFIKASLDTKPFSVAASLDIATSFSLIIWAAILLLR